jgi:hypothetical protein
MTLKNNVLIMVVNTEEVHAYSELTIPIMRNYANKHGYDFVATVQTYLPLSSTIERFITQAASKQDGEVSLNAVWNKILNLVYFAKDYDYIWILDADVVICDTKQSIDKYLVKHKIVASINGTNGGSLLNAGSMILDTKLVPEVLQSMFEYLHLYPDKFNTNFYEQDFINWYQEKSPYSFLVLRMEEINSHWSCINNTFVKHFMARSLDDKVKAIHECINQLKVINKQQYDN